MPSFYAPIDLIQNELRNARLHNLASAPGTPVEGQQYYNSANHTMYYWNGTQWVPMTAAAGGPPTGPAGGDLAGTYPNPTVWQAANGLTVLSPATPGPPLVINQGPSASQAIRITGNLAPPDVTLALSGGGVLVVSGAMMLGGILNVGSNRILAVADPTGPQDAATKNYVDNAINGTSWRQPVRVATTANITLSGTQTIDGVAVVAGDRVLVKNQTAPATNGIYVAAAGAWTRSTDADAWNELVNAAVFVSVGATQADTAWVSIVDAGGTIGTTAVTWVQFGAGATYTQGTGIVIAGNIISIDTAVVVQTSRQILTTAPITGGGNLGTDRTIGISSFAGSAAGAVPASAGGTTNFLRADGTWAAPPAPLPNAVGRFSAALSGTATYAAGEQLMHNLNTRSIVVSVVNSNAPYQRVEVDWEANTVNSVILRYSPNLGAGYVVTVHG